MASVESTENNDENFGKVSCFRGRKCRAIVEDSNKAISGIIDSNSTWTACQKESYKRRFSEVYEAAFIKSTVIDGHNLNSIDANEEQNETTEFEPVDQDLKQQLQYDLPFTLNNVIVETAKRRKTYPPYCSHYIKKETRIRCRCTEKMKAKVSSSLGNRPITPVNICQEVKSRLQSTTDDVPRLIKDLPSAVDRAKGLEQLSLLELKTKPRKKRRHASQSSRTRKGSKDSDHEEVANNNNYVEKKGTLVSLLSTGICRTNSALGSPYSLRIRDSSKVS